MLSAGDWRGEGSEEMNRKTGKIYTAAQIQLLKNYTLEVGKFTQHMQAVARELGCSVRSIPTPDLIMDMKLQPTEEQREKGRVGRNDPCPCDSGEKFKKCCMVK